MTQLLQYAFPAQLSAPRFRSEKKIVTRKAKIKSRALSIEDLELVHALESVKSELSNLHTRLDNTTDETLTDALIYELKAAGLKHTYYLNKMKERDIVFGE
ncbi:MAG: YaaL family protein [Defluviitaleaceae bacterium]|nr:YaaL family protein [Defluviitaleaceae bacterium]MCL2273741.1 YaaL family protein [Defluviitaleaceae bacterium]